MNIIDRSIVYSGQDNPARSSCAFPGICSLEGGRWICGFRAAATKDATAGQHAVVIVSDDEGKTWRETVIFKSAKVDGKPGLFRAAYPTPLGGERVLATLLWVDHSDPSLAFFNEETEGLLDSRIFLTESTDGGETWSKPASVDTMPFNIPTPITGPVLKLPDGRWACQFELNKPYYDKSEWRHSSVMMFSNDEGRTWPEHTVVSHDPDNRIFYWDQRPNVLGDDRMMDFFWTFDRRDAVYRNIHGKESFDGGLTWSPMWDTSISGQPAPPILLPDGKIALVYVDREGEPKIKVRLSNDGRNWPEESETIIHEIAGSQTVKKSTMQDAWREMGKFSVGLPATCAIKEGDLLVAYYAGSQTDRTDIHWARLRSITQ